MYNSTEWGKEVSYKSFELLDNFDVSTPKSLPSATRAQLLPMMADRTRANDFVYIGVA